MNKVTPVIAQDEILLNQTVLEPSIEIALLPQLGYSSTNRVFYSDRKLTIDCENRIVTVNGKSVELDPDQFDLLCCLVRYQGRAVSCRRLLTDIWGVEHAEEIDRLQFAIRCLRLKIEEDPSQPAYIRTAWGIGYRFCRK